MFDSSHSLAKCCMSVQVRAGFVVVPTHHPRAREWTTQMSSMSGRVRLDRTLAAHTKVRSFTVVIRFQIPVLFTLSNDRHSTRI